MGSSEPASPAPNCLEDAYSMNPLETEPSPAGTRKPDRKGLEEKVLQVVRDLLVELGSHRALRHLSPSASLERELGLGSLERVELLLRLERELSLKLPEHLLSRAEGVSDLVGAVMTAKSQAGASEWSAPETDGSDPLLLQQTGKPAPRPGGVDAWNREGGWPATLDEALFHFARRDPERVHIQLRLENGEMRPITYGGLLSQSSAVAAALRQRAGVQPGDRIALMLPTGADFFPAFFGAVLAGAVPVPLYPPWRPDRIEEYARRQAGIIADSGARVLVTFQEVGRLARLLGSQVPGLESVVTLDSLGTASGAVVRPLPRDVAFMQYTSGSTGDPKGVVLTHSNLIANIRAIAEALKIDSRDVGVSWLPLYHDMGLIGAWLSCLYLGVPVVIMPPQAFLTRPERWLWALHGYRATLSAAPNFAYELCMRRVDDRHLEGLDLSCLRATMNGAEPVQPETLEGFSRRFQPYGFRAEALMPVYGLAESSLAVTIPPLSRRPLLDPVDRGALERTGRAEPASAQSVNPLTFVSTGRPLAGHQVRIVSGAGSSLPDRVQGHIQCRGPSVMQGYFGRAEATAEVLQDGWLKTGDLGYLADGELFVTGRVKDIIIQGGRNLYPQELEHIAADVEGIRRGCVAAFGVSGRHLAGERLVLVAETRRTEPEEKEKLAAAIREKMDSQLGIPLDEVVLAPPQSVPKTSSGKIRRDACRRLYLQGMLHSPRSAVWVQVARLALRSLGQRTLRVIGRVGACLYGIYVWMVLLAVGLPCWVLLLLTPPRAGPRAGPALLRSISRITLRLAGLRPLVAGLEHLPAVHPSGRSRFLIVSNHASYLDILVLMAVLPFDFSFVAKREAASWPFVSTFVRRSGYLTVDRENAPEAVEDSRRIEERLLGGTPVHVFPEGTFTHASGLRPFQMGAFKLAADTGSPLLPVTLRGTRQVLRDGRLLPSPAPLRVVISPPIRPGGRGWPEMIRLRDAAYAEVLKHCGEGPLDLVLAGPPRAGAE
ncbi:MAG: AMP-binding protein [Acidobacteria bacterium]|nr:AMP-binding protein [Acidobacteriota bacterium]